MNIESAKIIELPKILDERGNLSFLEENNHVPFDIKRSYWIYDVPGGAIRGGHSYYKNQEFIIAISGSFDVVVDEGNNKRVFSLNRSYYGLYIPNNVWRQMDNFSTNSLAFVVASTNYDEFDYERDYESFLKNKNESFSL
jgi:dTDP-4-dehydrorhamnose 3,5-epimerase-like enzyme